MEKNGMTLPPVIRVFFAIDLPSAAKAVLADYLTQLKKQSKSHAIRWSRPENLHITLQFLAEVPPGAIDVMVAKVTQALRASLPQQRFHLGRLHIFPDPYRPRVIVMDVAPQVGLAEVSRFIGEGIVQAGLPIEDRPFRAHLTLGRIKQPQGLNLGFLSEAALPALDELNISEVVLFQSEPHPEGSHYTPLARLPLGNK
jgi:2'-5' RNA ligase